MRVSMVSSIEDLNKWTIHLMKAIQAKDPVYARMLEGSILTNGEKVTYGYGLEVNHDRGVYTVVHNGGWQGYRNMIMNFPDEQLSVILLSNYSNVDTYYYANKVAAYFLKNQSPAAPAVKDPAADLPTVALDTVQAKKYTGMYQLGPNWYVAFTLENGRLMVQANNENKFPTQAKSDSVFWVPAYGASMHFKNVNTLNGIIIFLFFNCLYFSFI